MKSIDRLSTYINIFNFDMSKQYKDKTVWTDVNGIVYISDNNKVDVEHYEPGTDKYNAYMAYDRTKKYLNRLQWDCILISQKLEKYYKKVGNAKEFAKEGRTLLKNQKIDGDEEKYLALLNREMKKIEDLHNDIGKLKKTIDTLINKITKFDR